MYWRIRKITPDQMLKRYGVYAALSCSILFNMVLLTRVSASKAMTSTQKLDYANFARQVTCHIFDSSYLTFEDSMAAVVNELSPQLANKLQTQQTLPRNSEELKAIAVQLNESKSVSCFKFDSVKVGDPVGQQGLLPVTVVMQVVVHDSQGVRPTKLQISYLVGTATNPKTNESHTVAADMTMQSL